MLVICFFTVVHTSLLVQNVSSSQYDNTWLYSVGQHETPYLQSYIWVELSTSK